MVGVQGLYIYVIAKQVLHPQGKLHKDFRGDRAKIYPLDFYFDRSLAEILEFPQNFTV